MYEHLTMYNLEFTCCLQRGKDYVMIFMWSFFFITIDTVSGTPSYYFDSFLSFLF